MEVRHAKTQLCIDSKSSTCCQHDNRWRLEWIICGKCDFAMIYSTLIICTFGTLKSIVPLKQIAWRWMSSDIGWRLLQEGFILLLQSIDASFACHASITCAIKLQASVGQALSQPWRCWFERKISRALRTCAGRINSRRQNKMSAVRLQCQQNYHAVLTSQIAAHSAASLLVGLSTVKVSLTRLEALGRRSAEPLSRGELLTQATTVCS